DGGGDDRLLPQPDGALQGAADRDFRPAAEDLDRQDPEVCVARPGEGSVTMGPQPKTEQRSSVVHRLRGQEAQLRAQGVAALALVGSVARGDDVASSDVDVLIDIQS